MFYQLPWTLESYMLPTLLALLLIAYLWCRRPDPSLPPSPCRPWPVIGHMFLLKRNPREQLKKWRAELGDIYSFYIGRTLVVVLNGYELIKEALVKKGDHFSDRPSFYVDQLVGLPNRGIMAASGKRWREQRSTSLSILKSFGMGKTILAGKIQEEITLYLNLLGGYGGQPVDIRMDTNMSISNIICSLLLGERFDYDDPTFQRLVSLMNVSVSNVGGVSLVNFMPFLRFLPGDLFKAKKVRDCVVELHHELGVRYIKDKGYNNYTEGEADSFIAAYIKEKNSRISSGKPTFLDDEDLVKILVEMFGAGMETSSSTILWCLLYILHHPHVQNGIHKELDSVVGPDRAPNIQDRAGLVYLNAVILETQRLASVAPLSAPHLCSEGATLGGFFIPKGTYVIPNLDSVLRGKNTWGEDADRFRPERFVDANGCLIHSEQMIPFSIGQRSCLGESMAKMELFLYLSSMFQRFSFLPEEPGFPPMISEVFGIVVMPGAYKVRVVNRHTTH